MILCSHPTGNANVRHAVRAMAEAGLLAEFWTSIGWTSEHPALRLLPPAWRKQLSRRAFPDSLHSKLRQSPWREIGRNLGLKLKWARLTEHEVGPFCVDAVYRSLDKRVASLLASRQGSQREVRGVYTYEDCAYYTFQSAKQQGIPCFYELPIAYWKLARQLLSEEKERWPEWEPTLAGVRDSEAKCERKTCELAWADVIIVPSRFVLDSIPEEIRREKPCTIAEFGSPVLSTPAVEKARDRAAPLRLLFAGAMTQRKGLADLFQAIRILDRNDVELTVLGSPLCPLEFYQKQCPGLRYEAPRSHAEVLQLMGEQDVFILPSIVEGRALVQQEAMACGLPLIVTPNAGGDDLVIEGETGFLVPIRSPETIADKIAWFADHRACLEEMRRAAMRVAAERSWERYGSILVEVLRKHLGNRPE
jgi:glycosyltransferase involved in cell wall biosynthesis